ncbi:Pls/PosA family non-ribosomal peptide synthetase [Wenjunlia tyrosinilytica]|uniref:Amino acid adenylation protein n=1 Tax=Wenjunlia tyrosinilytica TaxID=1544741 RepID=A0A917ZWI9_9ACTN|nr:Pls/PosA family non-ribosomal peptide synthetase [Wenjunlia tyrosinilytica]GGO94032.1 amino acid adenylation protein [Wenjunlia tyrosinilytica]
MTVVDEFETLLGPLREAAEASLAAPAVFSAGAPAAERTLLDILRETARRHPNAPAVDDGGTVLTYRALLAEVDALRSELAARGIGVGDRVGVRVPSGTVDLHVCVLAALAAGAAYVPVDAEDPDERADLVFSEAAVSAVLGAHRELELCGTPSGTAGEPGPGDDAWIIFTSGSTGRPKGVAVTHRSAAAFVDAEARLFLTEEPIGPGDRVLAGLSVAFDASCEEMWLAWRHGACLVPAPRSLVRTGLDLGPWLVQQGITVVSTVPTLASLWPAQALDDVRLLIFGGEACPPELAERMAVEGREVWNTYGPTEATVVACAAQLTGEGPVRIGLPLDGWELAVVDPRGEVVPMGETGELVIGGVGLARYLDRSKDREKYAPLPVLGWDRAYRSGDLVRAEEAGLLFVGRADEQVKLGGRRIELGEVDAALQALPDVAGAAAAVRTTRSGHQVLVGYVVGAADGGFDPAQALDRLREALPAALVPLLAQVDDLPTRTSGKVDRAALPWPLPSADKAERAVRLDGTQAWLAEQWTEVLGTSVGSADADFFAHGGGSLAAAQLVTLIRKRYPSASVGDVYQTRTLAALAAALDAFDGEEATSRQVRPTPRGAGVVQALLMLPLMTVTALRWSVALAAMNNVLALTGSYPWAPAVSWWWVLLGWLVFFSPAGRVGIAAGGARLLLRGLRPGTYPRGGGVHLRLWAAERLAAISGATSLTGSWLTHYARALGAKVGEGVDLHSLPPVTGMLKLGRGSAVEPEVDLSGHWLDGDLLHIGRIRIGAGARVGARGTLLPGARIGKRATVAPGSAVTGSVPAGRHWAGVPATRSGKAGHRRPQERPARSRLWSFLYGLTSLALVLLPVAAALPGILVAGLFLRGASTPGSALAGALLAVPAATAVSLLAYAALVLGGVRVLGVGMCEGHHPVHGRVALQAWATERLMSNARVVLFPLYASLFTPVWLRALGMRVGRGVEASTVLALPSMTTVGDGAFLADDTMVASYELGGGWMRIAEARIGKKAFLGNSGMTAPGRSVPNRGLVGVLSATPKRAKAGSSWLGMPPMKLPRSAHKGDRSRTFAPSRRLKAARAAVELCRIVPVMCAVALAVLVLAAFEALTARIGPGLGALCGSVVLLAAGVAACAVAIGAKWLLVGRFRAIERPLWSSFVWRNELADTFVETLAVPWLIAAVDGTPLMNLWLRGLGARIGRGVWCESHWLPEADLVRIGDGASVNRGCVVQTHLFHDRIMRMDEVTLEEGATLGPHAIVLPGATIGERTTVGPASLVMGGESVPAGTRWLGNPIAAWQTEGTRQTEGARRG